MRKVLSILLLLTATGAQASVSSFKAEDAAAIHPVRMAQEQPETDFNLKRSCGKPVLVFMRVPDGRIMLLGIFQPKQTC